MPCPQLLTLETFASQSTLQTYFNLATMAPSASISTNSNNATSDNSLHDVVAGEGTPMPTFLSTQPPPNQSWQITLKDKVIAITGVCLIALT